MEKFFIYSIILVCLSCNENKDWNVYGGSYERTQYVDSDKINKNNISDLVKVWEYRTFDNDKYSQIQTNPLIIDKKFYGVSPKLKLFSLDAKSGSEIWVFDPFKNNKKYFDNDDTSVNVCRGITYFEDIFQNSYIFYGVGSKLFKVNSKNGEPDFTLW